MELSKEIKELDASEVLVLSLEKGDVFIKLRKDLAPKHVKRIKELVKDGFYDGLNFHRVIDGFMAQTGCPKGTGTGGSGKKLEAEFSDEPHIRGTVSMARSMLPNSADSQFFICFDDCSWLDGEYTVWGQVVQGMELVDELKKGKDRSGSVDDPDKIVSIKILEDIL